jgi:glycine cleavage system H protein
LYTPIGGTVTEVNAALNDAPATVNDAANDTWMIKLAIKGEPSGDLLSAADYEKYVSEETGH